MENVVKAAVVTGICGVIGCTITGYCSYQAGESSVEQKVDNKISQSVNVEGMGYEKAIEYIINESNKLQDKNEQLEEEKSNLQKKIEELEDRSDVDKRGGGERGVSDKQSESDGEEIAFSNTPDILYDGTNYKVYSGEDSFSVGGEKQKSGYVLRCTAINGDGVALFNLNNKYKKMIFDVGRIDGSPQYSANLYIILSTGEDLEYSLLAEDISEPIEIAVENVKELKMVLNTEYAGGEYGFFNIKLYE